MKAKELEYADIEKWVTLRAKIGSIFSDCVQIQIESDRDEDGDWPLITIHNDTILEFCDPPAPVQEVGDVFLSEIDKYEWEIAAISEAAEGCLMARVSGAKDLAAAVYPLDLRIWTLARKGGAA